MNVPTAWFYAVATQLFGARDSGAALVRLSDRLLRKHSSGNLFKKSLLSGNF